MFRLKLKQRKKKYLKLKGLQKCPQRGGTCIKVFVTTPKKPNSALRKVTKIRLTNNRRIIAHIPGEKHNLLKFSSVLCKGYRVRDTPGIKYRVIRNAYGYNCKAVVWRTSSRSKYGTRDIAIKQEIIRSKINTFDIQDINLEDKITDNKNISKPVNIKKTLQEIRSKIIGPKKKLYGL